MHCYLPPLLCMGGGETGPSLPTIPGYGRQAARPPTDAQHAPSAPGASASAEQVALWLLGAIKGLPYLAGGGKYPM